MITRRKFAGAMLGVSIAGVAGVAFGETETIAKPIGGGRARDVARAADVRQQLLQIEARTKGRLGVGILDMASGQPMGLRLHERFPMCSTFKLLLCAAVLTRKDRGQEDLARKIVFSPVDVVPNSPVTGEHIGGAGMSVAALCEAAITRSDNTAANLLLASIGGPAAVTAFAGSIGDSVTRLDRIEPALNEALPGDPRDTTAPAAMLANLRELLSGDRLSEASRAQLQTWLIANQTGDARIRAKLPKDWRVGDKTGSGERGTTNDIAILWPARRAPIFVTVYLTGARVDAAQCDAAIADVGELIATLV